MKKFFIVATGIYLLLLALLNVLIGMSGFIMPNDLQQAQPIAPVFILLFSMPFVVWLGATGIGMFIKKNWARISLLVMSGFGIFVGILACAILGFMQFPDELNNMGTVVIIKSLTIGFFGFFLVIIPAIYLIFFTRKTVVQIFIGEDMVQTPSKRPTGITVLSLFSLGGGLISLLTFFTHKNTAVPIFGFLIEGLPMNIYMITIVIINLYIAFGFWHLHKPAWVTAIGIYCFGAVTSIFNALFLDAKMIDAISGQSNSEISMDPVVLKILMMFSAMFSLLLLAYVFTKKTAFYAVEEN